MSIINKYTTLILKNGLEYGFDDRNARDYANSIKEILQDFKLELLRDGNVNVYQLQKSQNLTNPT